jgi:hypothetical protein
MTFIVALRYDRISAPWVISGELFTLYVDKVLAPTLAKGEVVILDNLGSHKGKPARNSIRARGGALPAALQPRSQRARHRRRCNRASTIHHSRACLAQRSACLGREMLDLVTPHQPQFGPSVEEDHQRPFVRTGLDPGRPVAGGLDTAFREDRLIHGRNLRRRTVQWEIIAGSRVVS